MFILFPKIFNGCGIIGDRNDEELEDEWDGRLHFCGLEGEDGSKIPATC